jgi:hypothetical protein
MNVDEALRATDPLGRAHIPDPDSATGRRIMNVARSRGDSAAMSRFARSGSGGRVRTAIALSFLLLLPGTLVAAAALRGRPTPVGLQTHGIQTPVGGKSTATSPTSPSRVAAGPQSTYLPQSAGASLVDQLAVNFATTARDTTTPTQVTWVASTIGAVTNSFGGTNNNPTLAVWVMQIPGSFPISFLPILKNPAKSSGPRMAKYLELEVNQETLQVIGFGVSSHPPSDDLSALGTPEQDSLVGLAPNFNKIAAILSARGIHPHRQLVY